ncbi:MAG: hypothetical protein Q4P24_14855, partial [Rhodobacterales bacterium]|nr:hypothetical protein [Rhodobacterales bacterium]
QICQTTSVSICVVDDDGEIVAQGSAPADPEQIAGLLKKRTLTPKQIGMCIIFNRKAKSGSDAITHHLMTIPGFGPHSVIQLRRLAAYPDRVGQPSDVAVFLALTSRRHQSSEMSWSNHLWTCSDATMRGFRLKRVFA